MLQFERRFIEKPLFDLGELPELVAHPIWKQRLPEFPSHESLMLSHLSNQQIIAIIEALGKDSVLTTIPNTNNFEKPKLQLNQDLNLAFHNRGESRWCYLLKDEQKRKMAILLGGYNFDQVFPQDPKLVTVTKRFDTATMSYSDLNTYLCLPIILGTGEFSVPSTLTLQEWGGTKSLTDPDDPRVETTSERVRNAIISRNCTTTPNTEYELKHPRHYLLNQGDSFPPAVIDIPCELIISL